MYCPQCGTRLRSSDFYCPGCGAAVGGRKQKNTLPWLIAAICLLAAVLVLLILLLVRHKPDPVLPPVHTADVTAPAGGVQPTPTPDASPSPGAAQGLPGAALPPVSTPVQTPASGTASPASPAPAATPANAPVLVPVQTPAPTPAPTLAPSPVPAADPVSDFLANNRSIRTGLYPWGDAFRISGYALVDLSGDGVPELLLSTNESTFFDAEITGVLVCTVNGSSVTPVYYTDTDTVWPIPELLYDRWMVTREHGTGGYCRTTYMTLNSRGIDIMRELYPGLDEGESSYFIGDQEVGPEVFDQELLIRADHNTAPLREIVFTPLY